MTDRQIVLKYYPNAELMFHVYTHNTLRSTTEYSIISDNILKPHFTIAYGKFRSTAWRNAKNKILKEKA